MKQPFNGFTVTKDIPTGDNRRAAQVNRFARRVADYVETNPDYSNWEKPRAMIEAITILFNDIGAAHDFLNVLGLKVDLYTTDIDELNAYLEQRKKGE